MRALRMLDPRVMARNPVMFVTEIGSLLTTLATIAAIVSGAQLSVVLYFVAISLWLWLTVWFANFAEAIAEARGRAQAAALRSARQDVEASRITDRAGMIVEHVSSADLTAGDVVIVRAGEIIPVDGEVVEGVASVNEAAITGESAPVIRESGGDRSAVTGGTTVVSDWLIVRVTAKPGESFLDRMIALIEGAERKKTPNEIALTIVLAGFTIVFLMVCGTLYPIATYFDVYIDVPTLVALFVCLIPTTIGGLLSAIGIAGMARLGRANVMAMSGRAVEAAGDVDVLLLDKTGTITLGNRQATAFVPAPDVDERTLADVAQL
jgi:K+-transporting ATPase ATPase B chain